MLIIELLRRAQAALQRMNRRHRARRTLLELDDHMLDDIGIRREDALREGSKPFWRA